MTHSTSTRVHYSRRHGPPWPWFRTRRSGQRSRRKAQAVRTAFRTPLLDPAAAAALTCRDGLAVIGSRPLGGTETAVQDADLRRATATSGLGPPQQQHALPPPGARDTAPHPLLHRHPLCRSTHSSSTTSPTRRAIEASITSVGTGHPKKVCVATTHAAGAPGRRTLASSAKTRHMSSKYPTSIRTVLPRSPGPPSAAAATALSTASTAGSSSTSTEQGGGASRCDRSSDFRIRRRSPAPAQSPPLPVPAGISPNSHTYSGTAG